MGADISLWLPPGNLHKYAELAWCSSLRMIGRCNLRLSFIWHQGSDDAVEFTLGQYTTLELRE